MTYIQYGNSSYKYGNVNRLYGLPSVDPISPSIIRWIIEVDWANTGTYSGYNEADYCIDLQTRRGRPQRVNVDADGNASGIMMPRIGTARLVFDNATGRYDPYNTSGALYGMLLPGRFIRILARIYKPGDYSFSNYYSYPIFHGNIKRIIPQADPTNPTCTIECEDGMRLIQQGETSLPLSTNADFHTSINAILTEIGYPSIFGVMTAVTDAVNYMPYFWTTGNALSAIEDICNAAGLNFWVDAAGTARAIHFANSYSYPYKDPVFGPPVYGVGQTNTLKDISVPSPWENIKNYWKFNYNPITKNASGVIYSMGDTPLIAHGTSIEVFADYAYNQIPCRATTVIAPTTPTDYKMWTNSDGTGSDLSASFTVVLTDLGDKAKLTITNGDAALDGYVTLMQIRGEALVTNNKSYTQRNDTASQAIYGKLRLDMDSPYCQRYTEANKLYVFTGNLSSADPSIEVQFENRFPEQLTWDLFEGVQAQFAEFGINEQRVPGYIEHKWLTPNGQAVRTTIILENIR